MNCTILMLNSESCELKVIFYKEAISYLAIILFFGLLLFLRYLYTRFFVSISNTDLV